MADGNFKFASGIVVGIAMSYWVFAGPWYEALLILLAGMFCVGLFYRKEL